MMDFLHSILEYFEVNFPSIRYIVVGLPVSITFSYVALYLAGYLKKAHSWKTGYTRKLFHFITFFTAMFVQIKFGVSGVFVFGGGTSLVILYALLVGKDFVLYEAMAREKDFPKETLFIIQPYLATLIGGLTINYLFAPLLVGCSYLLAGCGDAMGEPVGTRFGKHKYRVPTLSSIKSYRSLEGSLSIFITCLFVTAIYFQFVDVNVFGWKIIVVALACTIIEAVSPHGWDNFAILVGSALVLSLLT